MVYNFVITNMTCVMCQKAVEKALKSFEEVTAVSVNFITGHARVEATNRPGLKEDLLAAVSKLGYQISVARKKTIDLAIESMSCAMCQKTIEEGLGSLLGIESVHVNLVSSTAKVVYDPQLIKGVDILGKLDQMGYPGHILSANVFEKPKGDDVHHKEKRKAFFLLIWSFILMIFAMAGMGLNPKLFAGVQLLLLVPILILVAPLFKRGFINLWKKSPTMDSLVAIGSLAAIVYSLAQVVRIFLGDSLASHHLYFESAGMVLAFVHFGKYLESRAKGQTRSAIQSLLALAPDKAALYRDGQEVLVDADELVVGDVIVVRPGDRIAGDGHLIYGRTSVDESMLTGESRPIDKELMDPVVLGSINLSGLIHVEIDRLQEESHLAKIIDMVDQVALSKPSLARLADRLAAIFVPLVLILALATFSGWYFFTHDLEVALLHMISVMVVACPCSLGLATPTAIMVGSGVGAKNHIFIKSSEDIEIASTISRVALDKTGTLTTGKMTVLNVVTWIDSKEFIDLVFSLESGSTHPIAKAVVAYCQERQAKLLNLVDFHSRQGFGLIAQVDKRPLVIGNQALFLDEGIDLSGKDLGDQYLNQGHTVVYVAYDGSYIGYMVVGDTLRPEALEAVSDLKKLGLIPVLITGDHEASGRAMAEKVGIDQVFAGVLPQEKATLIAGFQAQDDRVMMVGDGINDAVALVQSDLGVAISQGTDVAIDSADVVLMKNDLRLLATGLRLMRAIMANVRQNLFWAFFYNLLALPLAMGLFEWAGIHLSPMVAGLAMALSSLSVVTNALRLKRFK